MLCALINRVAKPGQSEPELRQRMEHQFSERGDIVQFMTGIRTSQNLVTGRTECHYPELKARRAKPRRERIGPIRFPLSENSLSVFNRLNAESVDQEK